MNETGQFDLLIIGGGINGAGIARDAAGRGLRVLLAEQNDLASGTSSRSSKMIHGGLRYLETYQFRLVREALQEREVLLKIAPHIIRPLKFILPHVQSMRPRWMLNAGLWLYDHIGGRMSLPRSGTLDLEISPEGRPLLPRYTQGFHYSDCWVEDMRLVVLNAQDAAGRGADILTRTRVTSLHAEDGGWRVRLSGNREISAKVVINAAGPWVGETIGLTAPAQTPVKPPVRLVKGSHIIVPRLYDGEWAYLCQNDDGRVVFFWPYERDFTLIGTTDVPFEGNPANVTCSDEEKDYLLGVARNFFRAAPGKLSIVHTYAGVRSLYDDGAKSAKDVTRDYKLTLEHRPAPFLSIYGGKITTYRRLAEHAMELLAPLFPQAGSAWTGSSPLPGGDIEGTHADFVAAMRERHSWLPADLCHRWCRLYGTRIREIIGSAQSLKELGELLAPGLYEAEAEYLVTHEFAHTAEDILWRRTRLGLRLAGAETSRLQEWLAKRL